MAKEVIEVIDKGESHSKMIEIRADYSDTYVIEIKAKYKSAFFKEKLKSLDIDNMTPAQKGKIQNKESYRIDFATRDVIRNFSKKFKFQTKSPFQLTQKIIVQQNKYCKTPPGEESSENQDSVPTEPSIMPPSKLSQKPNAYFMEITLKNDSSLLSLQSVQLEVTNYELDLTDLNRMEHKDEAGGVKMKKNEKR